MQRKHKKKHKKKKKPHKTMPSGLKTEGTHLKINLRKSTKAQSVTSHVP